MAFEIPHLPGVLQLAGRVEIIAPYHHIHHSVEVEHTHPRHGRQQGRAGSGSIERGVQHAENTVDSLMFEKPGSSVILYRCTVAPKLSLLGIFHHDITGTCTRTYLIERRGNNSKSTD